MPGGTGRKVSGSTAFRRVFRGTGRPRSRTVVGVPSAARATERRVWKAKVSGPVSLWPQPCIHSGRRRALAPR